MTKTTSLSGGQRTYSVKRNFKGWKLISIPLEDFGIVYDMGWESVLKIHFDSKQTSRELYFDSIWLSQQDETDNSKLISEVNVNGVPASYIPGDTINIAADVFDANESKVQLFVAEYDEAGALINISAQAQTLADNTVSLSSGLTTLSNSAKVKVYVFGAKTCLPLSRAIQTTASAAE